MREIMKFNKIILICLLLLVFLSFGAVSAVEDANSTDDLTVQATDVSDDLTLDNINEISQTNDEMLKEENAPIVITNDTFSNYFDDEGKISDSVAEGATLDFQGQITSSENIKAIYINKSVNIISSTKDATITLNTKNGQLGKENISGRFIVEGVTELNINDVTFNRTQVLIYDSYNVIFDNVNFISDNYRIVPKLRDNYDMVPMVNTTNVEKFTFKNSQVYVYDFGSIVIGCYDTKEALFDNNTFRGFAGEFDRTDYDGKGRSFAYMIYFPEQDASVIINNNKFYGNGSFKFVRIYSSNILFENNYEEYSNALDSVKLILGHDKSNVCVKDNNLLDLIVDGNATVYNNVIKQKVEFNNALVYNNTLGSDLTQCSARIGSNITFCNDINGTAIITGDNVILKDSIITGGVILSNTKIKNITVKNNYIGGVVTVYSTETYIVNNTIIGGIKLDSMANNEIYIIDNIIYGDITIDKSANCEIRKNLINGIINIDSSDSLIEFNVIKAFDSDYAIYIMAGKDYIRNEVSDNEIYSKWYCGDNAVSYDENFINYIEYNTPSTQIGMLVNNTVGVFDYGGNTTILVNVPGVSGNVSIDVGNEKYIVNLVNGYASQVLTKYSLGFNYVTVIYYDEVDDVWAIDHTNFTVNKVTYCPVELVYGTMSEGIPSNINFILPKDADGTIFVSLTYGNYTVDIEQVAKGENNVISLPGLPEGDYAITATFTSIKYVTNSSTGNIRFVHKPVYKLTSNNVVMDYKDESKYKVLVTKDGKAVGAGETVKITFNGKATEVKTDKNGYATLTLDGTPKTYTIKAEYKGVTKSSKVTIKNILKAKNISKKKAKKVKFSATIKTSKGKAIVGKKISFKLKGKTYSAKTNKKGVATISIKNLKVGKHTITSKYGECAVKNTITIKK